MTDAPVGVPVGGVSVFPKKRGRPRKERPADTQMETGLESSPSFADILVRANNFSVKRGPGRPRKKFSSFVKPIVPPPGPDLDAPAQLDGDDFSLSHIPHDVSTNNLPLENEIIKKRRGRPPKNSFSSSSSHTSPMHAEIEALILQANGDDSTVPEILPDRRSQDKDSPKGAHPTSPTQAEMDELLFSDEGHADDATLHDDTVIHRPRDALIVPKKRSLPTNPHHHQHHQNNTINHHHDSRNLNSNGKRPASPNVLQPPPQPDEDSSEDHAPSLRPPPKCGRRNMRRTPSQCVCNWGEECARFRRFFERVKEREGECIFAGTFRPNIGGGERQANFLDAVDRHLSTSQEVRERSYGRYVIANHHWPINVLQHIKRVHVRSFLLPVSNEVAVELGITSDPADEYQTHVEPDEYGRLRPVRSEDDSSETTENDDEEKQWVLAPCHGYSDVKAIVDDGIAREIEKRIQEKKEEKRKRLEIDETEDEAAKAEHDEEGDARMAELEQELVDKTARIVQLEEALEDAKESNQMLQTQLRIVIKQIRD